MNIYKFHACSVAVINKFTEKIAQIDISFYNGHSNPSQKRFPA
jgi:hypothetical protein